LQPDILLFLYIIQYTAAINIVYRKTSQYYYKLISLRQSIRDGLHTIVRLV